jgi:hypothetical protein
LKAKLAHQSVECRTDSRLTLAHDLRDLAVGHARSKLHGDEFLVVALVIIYLVTRPTPALNSVEGPADESLEESWSPAEPDEMPDLQALENEISPIDE